MGNNKIGIGVITCNREHFFRKCISNLPELDSIIVINDGNEYSSVRYPSHVKNIVHHKKNMGVTKSKNEALRFLLNEGCTHIFLHEDDVVITDSRIIDKYIQAAEVSGILHFNYAYHGPGNRSDDGTPAYRTVIDYPKKVKISLNRHVLGAVSYYHRTVLEKVGLMDERLKNAWDHVDHTYQIIKAGYHPPFWWFADLFESHKFIDDLDKTHGASVIRNRSAWNWRYRLNYYIFRLKNGVYPMRIPDTSEEEVVRILKNKL